MSQELEGAIPSRPMHQARSDVVSKRVIGERIGAEERKDLFETLLERMYSVRVFCQLGGDVELRPTEFGSADSFAHSLFIPVVLCMFTIVRTCSTSRVSKARSIVPSPRCVALPEQYRHAESLSQEQFQCTCGCLFQSLPTRCLV